MRLDEFSDDVFWNEATRRWKQKTLTPADPHRAEVMGALSCGQPLHQPPPQPEVYPVVCSACGSQTTVPFKPNPNRKIYCLDCYRAGCGR